MHGNVALHISSSNVCCVQVELNPSYIQFHFSTKTIFSHLMSSIGKLTQYAIFLNAVFVIPRIIQKFETIR